MNSTGSASLDADHAWKYMICAPGRPSWDEFSSGHAHYATDTLSPSRVAKEVADRHGVDDMTLICLEGPDGERYEISVAVEITTAYEIASTVRRGKKGS